MPRLALTLAACTVASKAIAVWLGRQQMYAADAMAAAISTTAGCSSDSIITSMQPAYYAEDQRRAAVDRSCNEQMELGLAELQYVLNSATYHHSHLMIAQVCIKCKMLQ